MANTLSAETARAVEDLQRARRELEQALARCTNRVADTALLNLLLKAKCERLETRLREAGLLPMRATA